MRIINVNATAAECRTARPGDEIVGDANVVMDRALTVAATPERVWPWLVQLGKQRAGWYVPRAVETVIPRARRAIRHVDDRWQNLQVGDVIPDYGGPTGYFEVAEISAPRTLVYCSTRGRTQLSWAITLEPFPATVGATRICLRLRVRAGRPNLARLGEIVDILTIAALGAGLSERLAQSPRGGSIPGHMSGVLSA